MEDLSPLRRFGWVPGKAFALLLALGAVSLAVWLSMASATQAAGAYRDVQLTVVNKATRSVSVSVCDHATISASSCPEFYDHQVAPGKSAWRSHHTVYGRVLSYDHGPGWSITYRFDFADFRMV